MICWSKGNGDFTQERLIHEHVFQDLLLSVIQINLHSRRRISIR